MVSIDRRCSLSAWMTFNVFIVHSCHVQDSNPDQDTMMLATCSYKNALAPNLWIVHNFYSSVSPLTDDIIRKVQDSNQSSTGNNQHASYFDTYRLCHRTLLMALPPSMNFYTILHQTQSLRLSCMTSYDASSMLWKFQIELWKSVT